MKYKLLSSAYYQGAEVYNQLYNNRINSDSTCKFDFLIKGNPAFVVITHEMLNKISMILEINQNLTLITHILPNVAVNQYAKRCLLDEIYLTNEIEGIQSTRKEINDIFETKEKPKKYKRLFALVKKYEALLNSTELQLASCENIRELYDDFVLEDVVKEDPENKPDGKFFRTGPVYVQKNGENIHKGLLPEAEIINCMTESLHMLNDENYNLLIRTAVFHYVFGYIHPFYDGNGRMSRFISSYMLSQKLNLLVSCRLTCAIKDKLSSYYKAFNVANDEKNKGDLTHFVLTFLDIIIAAETELLEALEERRHRLEFYRLSIDKLTNDKKVAQLIFVLIQNTLFGNHGLSINELTNITDAGASKVRNTIKDLENKGLIRKSKKGNACLYDLDLDNISSL